MKESSDDLGESMGMALVGLEGISITLDPVCFHTKRSIHETKRTLRRRANTSYTKYKKGRIEEHKLEIQEMLEILNAHRSPLDTNFSVDERL